MPADETPFITDLEARSKINQAIAKVGLSFADVLHLIRFDSAAETAYWAFDPITGREWIGIGSMVAMLSVCDLEMVLRHEFLHRASYNGFKEDYPEAQLANIVLDVCINRLLYEAYPEKMLSLSSQIYSEASRLSILALSDCSALSTIRDESIRALWKEIWSVTDEGSHPYLNPTSLYARLLTLREKNIFIFICDDGPFGTIKADHPIEFGQDLADALGKITADLGRRLPSGSALGREIAIRLGYMSDLGFSRVARFLEEIEIAFEDCTESSHVRYEVAYQVQAFPQYPTRLGIVYRALGIEDITGYRNRTWERQRDRLKVGYYIDVSPSMKEHYPVLVQFVRQFRAFPVKLFAFSSDLYEMDVERFAKGILKGGNGTDFNPPVLSIAEDHDLMGGVIFTDGIAQLDPDIAQKFRSCGKSLFVVYLTIFGSKRKLSPLDELANRVLEFADGG